MMLQDNITLSQYRVQISLTQLSCHNKVCVFYELQLNSINYDEMI
jgi:hypothetical protein